ncbi:MAG: peptide chain release factor N(5)-glutamine methyltransferase [Clostridiales bacterium]|nr:peptide chain release factor N(5)-glutamine methyltransferase [Clostridiales bacterium]
MTLYQLLAEGTAALGKAGIPDEDAARDARELLLAAFAMDLARFLLERTRQMPEDETSFRKTEKYRQLIARRSERCPQQQILGCQEFMGLPFYVDENVLIPRQDTETLVELVLAEQGRTAGKKKRLLDLCTGSGCIAISLAVKGQFPSVAATDISAAAIAVAERNAKTLVPAQKIHFYQGDLFAALPEGCFDVIVSNPPYIPTAVIAGLQPEVRDFEPRQALDGSADGLAFYRRIAAEAGGYLADGGSLYLEIGYDQGVAVAELLRVAGFANVRIHRDLAGRDRVVSAYGFARS